MNTIKNIITLFVLIFLFSCSQEDDNSNQPILSDFSIEVSNITPNNVRITWEKSISSTNSIVFYDVYISDEKVLDNTENLNYLFSGLKENTKYSGAIIASDVQGNEKKSFFEFTTGKTKLISDFQISLESTNSYFPRIEWNHNLEKDNTDVNIVYDIFLENELIEENSSKKSFDFKELRGNTSYNIKILAKRETKSVERSIILKTDLKVFDDNPVLDTQDKIIQFAKKGYNVIEDNLFIGSFKFDTDIIDLTLLNDLIEVQGNLWIKRTKCKNLNGLQNIILNHRVPNLEIESNENLQSLEGLSKISNLYNLKIYQNKQLNSLNGLTKLISVSNYTSISLNPNLEDLSGLMSLNSLNNLSVTSNLKLKNLKGLENISMATSISLSSNESLISLSGLDNLKNIGSLTIENCNALSNLNELNNLKSISGDLYIKNNQNLNNLLGLSSLNELGHEMIISSCPKINSLEGIQNIRFSTPDRYKSITISNLEIEHLDQLSSYLYNKGAIHIIENPKLKNMCGITDLVLNLDTQISSLTVYSARNNAINTSINDFKTGNCK